MQRRAAVRGVRWHKAALGAFERTRATRASAGLENLEPVGFQDGEDLKFGFWLVFFFFLGGPHFLLRGPSVISGLLCVTFQPRARQPLYMMHEHGSLKPARKGLFIEHANKLLALAWNLN